MLKGGANIRYIQQALGYERLELAAIFTESTSDWFKKFTAASIPPGDLPPDPIPRRFFLMAITLDEIVEETAQLPEDVAAELVERILVKRHGSIAQDVEAAWKAETRRRVAEITSGQVVGIPLEESLARASRALRQ